MAVTTSAVSSTTSMLPSPRSTSFSNIEKAVRPVDTTAPPPSLRLGQDVRGWRGDGLLSWQLRLGIKGVIPLAPGERFEDRLLALTPVAISVKQVTEQKKQRERLATAAYLKGPRGALSLHRLQER